MIASHRALVLVAALLSSPSLAVARDRVDPRAHQQFADDLAARLHARANECSSALGVSMAFSLLYPGCTGEATAQVRETLRYPADHRQLVWEGAAERMAGAAAGQCVEEYGEVCYAAAPVLRIANSVWFDDGDALAPEYAAVVGDYARQIDLEAGDSPLLVNEWVSDATNGLIDEIVPEGAPLSPPNVLMAINSIYLKAEWDEQFKEHRTNLDSFYDSVSRSTEVSEAHFMHAVERFPYSDGALPGHQLLSMPFANSNTSMVFVLPMMDGAETVLSTDVMAALEGLQPTRLALAVPKFKFESAYTTALEDALFQLGIEAPFTAGAGGLCGLFQNEEGCERLVIGSVIQKTVIDVNEGGVEAAAVTAMGVKVTSAEPADRDDPVLVVLDHPFQFFIHDATENLMLFEGRLGAPQVPGVAPAAPLLDARHADRNFWSKTFNVRPVAPVAVGNVTTTAAPSATQPACSARQTCRDCLLDADAAPSSCAWVPVEGCMDSCDRIADAACYTHRAFADEGLDGRQICARAAADEADARLCGTKGDCASCTAAVLSDGSTTCQWFDDGGGFCGSGCGMIGCGVTTCDADAAAPAEEVSQGEVPDSPAAGLGEASDPSVTPPTDADGSATNETTDLSEPITTQPTEASDPAVSEPTDEADPDAIISPGNIVNDAIVSICTGFFLALALVIVQ